MSGYLSEARRHAEKIKHYYDHGGSKGYSQSLYHYKMLSSLVFKAMRSKKYKEEAPLINSIRTSMEKLMDEMKDRKESADIK